MEGEKKALIIGCGNIGALYDYKKEGIRTHLKAFATNPYFRTTIYDKDLKLSNELAEYYHVGYFTELTSKDMAGFDVVVVSSPTSTHYELLKQALELNIPVIVCEKPISDSLKHLESLAEIKTKSTSKVIINYFRRFHPSFHQLKNDIAAFNEKLTNIQVTYQRGFLNNASHALDLLNYLLEGGTLDDIWVHSYCFDEFNNDPTITLSANIYNVPILLQGLQEVKFSYFEIKLFFQNSIIHIEKNGEKISIHSNGGKKENGFYLPLQPVPTRFDGINAILDPMKYLVETVIEYFEDPSLEDNFISSLNLNKSLLKISGEICHN